LRGHRKVFPSETYCEKPSCGCIEGSPRGTDPGRHKDLASRNGRGLKIPGRGIDHAATTYCSDGTRRRYTLSFHLRRERACANAADSSCRATVAKEVGSHLKKVLKTITKCHTGRAKAKVALTIDCNDLAEADATDSLAASRSHLTGAITAACSSAPSAVANYARCPSPAQDADDAGATAGIDSAPELGACMAALVENLSQQVAVEALGLPRVRPSKSLAGCQKQIGKGVSKLMVTTVKERASCQADRDAANMGLAYGCVGSDPRGKIGKALTKFKDGVAKRCVVDADPGMTEKQEIDVMQACGDTAAQLQQCAGDVAASRTGSGIAAMAYELPATCTAGRVLRVLQSGAGEEFTHTFLSTGWTGTAHLVDVLDNARETVVLACDADCTNCTMSLDKRKGQPDAICRCQGDPTISCDTFNAPDVDDCGLPLPPGNNTCNCNFGAPAAAIVGRCAGVCAEPPPFRLDQHQDGRRHRSPGGRGQRYRHDLPRREHADHALPRVPRRRRGE
jgi:hypothetical protein